MLTKTKGKKKSMSMNFTSDFLSAANLRCKSKEICLNLGK